MPETPAPAPSRVQLSTLTERERAILDHETAHPTHRPDGSRERRVLESFGLPMTRYLQLLNALIDRADALAYAPVTVARLLRVRDRGRTPWL